MAPQTIGVSAACIAALLLSSARAEGGIRGFNTWDGYMGPSNETIFLAAAEFLAQELLPFGYDHAVIDGGWYGNSGGPNLDGNGRPLPRSDIFPSATGGKGFAPLAAKIHALGLRFGVWTIRGIPKAAVHAKLPIANSPFTAADAADTSNASLCSWDSDNYGVQTNAAGRAYYESLAVLYASWGVDIVKIDCMVGDGTTGAGAHAGLYTAEFTLFAETFGAHGITVSVSPGTSMNLANATYIGQRRLAEQYRITNDFWDIWDNGGKFYPTDLKSKFGKFAALAPVIGLGGAYPDGDGLAVGVMFHDGDSSTTPSLTHLSHDEQTTMLTLWSVARAPLIVTAQLPLLANDTWTLPLLTNAEVLLVQNASHGNRPIPTLQNASAADVHAWAATPDGAASSSSEAYFALFNAADTPGPVSVAITSGGLAPGGNYCARDLWAHTDLPSVSGDTFGVASLPAHGAGMYRLRAC